MKEILIIKKKQECVSEVFIGDDRHYKKNKWLFSNMKNINITYMLEKLQNGLDSSLMAERHTIMMINELVEKGDLLYFENEEEAKKFYLKNVKVHIGGKKEFWRPREDSNWNVLKEIERYLSLSILKDKAREKIIKQITNN